jgi:hypothetical protein
MGYDTIEHGLWKCGLHSTLRNELQEKFRAAEIDHGRSSIMDILAMRNMVALRLIFEYSILFSPHLPFSKKKKKIKNPKFVHI